MKNKHFLTQNEYLETDYTALEGILTFSGQQNQMLTFQIEEETYGIEIHKIKELVRYSPEQPPKIVPNVPPAIIGVINVRGEVIPVMDLRKKIGLTQRVYGKFDVIVILKTEKQHLGLLVDEVKDVIPIPKESAGDVPSYVGKLDISFIKTLCHGKDGIIAIIDTEHLVCEAE